MCGSEHPAGLVACVGTGPIVYIFASIHLFLWVFFCISWSLFWIVKTSRTPFPGKHEENTVFPIRNVSPQNNFYILIHLDKKDVLQNALKFIIVRLQVDTYHGEMMCLLKLLVGNCQSPWKWEWQQRQVFFLLRYLQVNNLCPTLKSRGDQSVALLCKPSWDMLIIWGKLCPSIGLVSVWLFKR